MLIEVTFEPKQETERWDSIFKGRISGKVSKLA